MSKDFAFVGRVADDVWCVGYHQAKGPCIFLDAFLPSFDAEIPQNAFSKLLFAVDVMPQFFKWNPIYQIKPSPEIDVAGLDLPDKAIFATWNSDKPKGEPYWEGREFSEKGGSLWRLMPDRSPMNYVERYECIIPELNVDEHAKEILKYPMTIGAVDGDLRERLMCCHLLGREVDPIKARIFPDHPDLQDELLKQSHYFFKHRMPILNAHLDLETNRWVQD